MGVITSIPCQEKVPPNCGRCDWMGVLLSKEPVKFGARKLYEISIPATHNSATYNVKPTIISSIAMCQKYDILHQLRSGVRLLDLRICDDTPDNVIMISHRFLCGSLGEVFHQIYSFIFENKSEIIVVAIKKDWDRELSQEGYDTMVQMASNYFAGYLMTREDLETLPVSELVRQNKRVHFSSPGLEHTPIRTSDVAQTWSATYSPYCKTLVKNLSAFIHDSGSRQIKIHDCYLTPSPKSVAYWSVNGTNWHKLQRNTNIQILSWLKRVRGKIPFNAVSVDMVDQEIIDLVISLNSDS
ncbi:hypothetical protein DSO57_1017722 [Entomophthora muscae]|uniref:Uncharacterized protein n=1 Tax=Entomophthora muscae TaxID=34485 RepID=A0ACC2TFC8_9FUNG|nr:hypothetical protein DSO57_1017722 [Entomophthora muscae]